MAYRVLPRVLGCLTTAPDHPHAIPAASNGPHGPLLGFPWADSAVEFRPNLPDRRRVTDSLGHRVGCPGVHIAAQGRGGVGVAHVLRLNASGYPRLVSHRLWTVTDAIEPAPAESVPKPCIWAKNLDLHICSCGFLLWIVDQLGCGAGGAVRGARGAH